MQRFTDFGPDKARDACFLPDNASATDKASVAAAVSLLGLSTEAEKSGRLSVHEIIDRAVAKATEPLRAESYRLRKELNDFRSAQSEQFGVKW